MSATNFNTKNDTYRKLMGNGLTYRVPRFQRDYSWTEEEWEDLWLDILGPIGNRGEPAYLASGLALTRRIAEEDADWTPERLAARQNWMADQATAIWRVDQLS